MTFLDRLCEMATAALQCSRSAIIRHRYHSPPRKEPAENSSKDSGDYSARPHELISSTHSLYEVLEPLGEFITVT